MQNLDELFPIVTLNPDLPNYKVPWLIEGIWQKGKINAVTGYVKAGKSRLLNWFLAHLIAEKSPFGLGILPMQKMLYLTGEEPIYEVNQRLKFNLESINGNVKNLEKVDIIDAAGFRLDFDRYRQWLGEKLPFYDLLVIDPLRRVHGGDENDNSEMAKINSELRRWTNKLGHSLIFVHHTPKPFDGADMTRLESWMRGAGDFAAIVDTASYVERMGGGKINLKRAGRFPPLPDLKIQDLNGVFK